MVFTSFSDKKHAGTELALPVEVHLSSGQKAADIRCSLVVLDPQKIDHISVVRFTRTSDVSPKGALVERANTMPICEPGKYCPLIVVHPSSFQPPRGFLPSGAILLSEDDAAALPHDTFAHMDGELWYERPSSVELQAMVSFSKRQVTPASAARLGVEVKPVLPSESCDDGIGR